MPLRKPYAALLTFCFGCLACAQSSAAGLGRLALTITSTQTEATREIVEALLKRFPSASVVSAAQLEAAKQRNAVHIAVGPVALRAVLAANPEGAVVSVFTSSLVYRELLTNAPRPRRGSVTAIYAEPAPVEQLRLIRAIYKVPVTTAVLLGPGSSYLVPALKDAATEASVDIVLETVSPNETINRALNRVAHRPVLLALPDSSIYNAESARNILITTYRHQQAIIGFSAAFVKAGALATTFSKVDDVTAQLDEVLRDFAESGQFPPEQFPRYFEVAVNDSVARSLNLVIDDSVKRLGRKPTASRP
jgi:ABC-type uncharacterized transport system substrate-binding protein